MPDLRKVTTGDNLSANQWNEIVRRLGLITFGQGAFQTGAGISFRPVGGGTDTSVIDIQIQDPHEFDLLITDGIWRVQPFKVKLYTATDELGVGAADGEAFDCYLRTIDRPEKEATEPEVLALYNTLNEIGEEETDTTKHSPRYDIVLIKDEVLKAHFIPNENKFYLLYEAKGIVPVPETNEICA